MSARNHSVCEWEGFAKSLAAKYVKPGVDLEDLEQEALLTLLEELPKYSRDLGVSLKVFLGRGIRNRLASLYRKTLNLVQLEQYWEVKHFSGDKELSVKASSREQAEAVLQARPDEFVGAKHVKVLAQIGPSLDEEVEGASDDGEGLLHERVGAGPEQELGMLAAEMSTKVTTKLVRKGNELAEIFRLRSEGHTFEEIGEIVGKDGNTVYKAFVRAQKRLNAKKAA